MLQVIINTLNAVKLCVTTCKLLRTGTAGIPASEITLLLTSEKNSVLTVTASGDLSSAMLLAQQVHRNMGFLEPARNRATALTASRYLVILAPCFVPGPHNPCWMLKLHALYIYSHTHPSIYTRIQAGTNAGRGGLWIPLLQAPADPRWVLQTPRQPAGPAAPTATGQHLPYLHGERKRHLPPAPCLPAAPVAGRLAGPLVGAAEGGGASCTPARRSWRGPARSPGPFLLSRRGGGWARPAPGVQATLTGTMTATAPRPRPPGSGSRCTSSCPQHQPNPGPAIPHMPGLTRPHWGRGAAAGPSPSPHTHRQRGRCRCHSHRRLPPLLQPPPLRPEQVPGEEGRVPAGRAGRSCSPRPRQRERAGGGRAPRKRRGGRARVVVAAVPPPTPPLAAAPRLPGSVLPTALSPCSRSGWALSGAGAGRLRAGHSFRAAVSAKRTEGYFELWGAPQRESPVRSRPFPWRFSPGPPRARLLHGAKGSWSGAGPKRRSRGPSPFTGVRQERLGEAWQVRPAVTSTALPWWSRTPTGKARSRCCWAARRYRGRSLLVTACCC